MVKSCACITKKLFQCHQTLPVLRRDLGLGTRLAASGSLIPTLLLHAESVFKFESLQQDLDMTNQARWEKMDVASHLAIDEAIKLYQNSNDK